ncbi:mab-21 protein domain-containing protein [Phthorimaea operculella]|nr:mab-21 protein domain-containing protein [Phthorimaea operculella]
MNQNRNNRNRNDNDEGSWNGWKVAGAVVGGLAAVAGIGYMISRNREQPQTTSPAAAARGAPVRVTSTTHQSRSPSQDSSSSSSSDQSGNSASNYVASLVQRLTNNDSESTAGRARRGVPRDSVPRIPSITNMDSLLHDIYLRYISLNDEDFERYYNVVHEIFLQLHSKMKEVDPYYKKYSSTVQFAGSHPDRLRINKPDEFDIDIVIGLPLSIKSNPINPAESDFIIESKDPGFVQLKVGVQFERLPQRDGNEWQNNRAAYEWKDEKNYLLRSKFSDWFKSVVNRALNEFVENRTLPPIFYVAGVPYVVSKSESGPAMTMYIENRAKDFKLDVDLVPALRFPIDRWPINNSYRSIPPVCAGKDYWMVVPKPNKGGHTVHDKNRSWRVALHEQEGRLMHSNNNMKQAIRLIKKFRDAQNMKKIASYYIKTIFFWEIMERQNDREYWNNSPAFLFKAMLKKLHAYLVEGRIPYFWNKNNNLIGSVDRTTLNQYATKVEMLLATLENPAEYRQVAKYLLTATEFNEYRQFLNI